MPKFKGTEGDDPLAGTEGRDILIGYAGNDTLSGLGGNDVMKPGTGIDTLSGGDGDDLAIFDNLDQTQPDTFDGGIGIDTIDLTKTDSPFFHLVSWYFDPFDLNYTARIFGDAAPAITFTGVEHMIGSHEDDQMSFGFSDDDLRLEGGRGDDYLAAGDGDDVLIGGAGDDYLSGGLGYARLSGGDGRDTLAITDWGSGVLDGGDGSDTVVMSGDADLLKGVGHNALGDLVTLRSIENLTITLTQEGATVRGTDRANVLDASGSIYGGSLFGGRGNDTITGGDGADRLHGDEGNDVLAGGFGADQLTGGKGADLFVFADDDLDRAFATDRITDFHQDERDQLDVAGIDANATTDVHNDFRFIGTKAFSNDAGELRYEIGGTQTRVMGDTDGDGRADFTIVLAGKVQLDIRDFVLVHLGGAEASAGGHLPLGAHVTPYPDGTLP